jgi:hypothetical protein
MFTVQLSYIQFKIRTHILHWDITTKGSRSTEQLSPAADFVAEILFPSIDLMYDSATKILRNYSSWGYKHIVQCLGSFHTSVKCLQVILTPTCRVSGYPRQVIKVETLLRQLRFIWTALPTVITLITIIPLGTYDNSSWYIFLSRRCDPTSHSRF